MKMQFQQFQHPCPVANCDAMLHGQVEVTTPPTNATCAPDS